MTAEKSSQHHSGATTSAPPRVSVVMPVYNGGPYIGAALDSICGQSFPDFELLVLDDGSTDDSAAVVKGHQSRDARVQLHRFPHRGLVATLNDGLELARGEYIARADADDLYLPHRLAVQCAYMDRHPDIGLCGTSMQVIDRHVWQVAVDPDEIRCQLLFYMPTPHGALMLRGDWLRTSGLKYDSGFAHAEDYDLLERAAGLTRIGNVPDILYAYRRHADQVSIVHAEIQAENSRRVRSRQLVRLGIPPEEIDYDIHRQLSDGALLGAPDAAVQWLRHLAKVNQRTQTYPPEVLRKILAERLYRACMDSPVLRARTVIAFRRSDLDDQVSKSKTRALRMIVRASVPTRAIRPLVRKVRQIRMPLSATPSNRSRSPRHLLRYGELDLREFFILHDRALVFLVVSKVACTSIKVAIASAYGLDVKDPEAIHDNDLWRREIPSFEHAVGHCPDRCRDYFKFAFVRNPLDRMVSCYEDKVAGSDRTPFVFPRYPIPAGISFERFARIVARIPDRLADRHFRGQASTLYDNGQLQVDFVGRFESLQDDWSRIAQLCNLPTPLPHTNATPSKQRDYLSYYSAQTFRTVSHRYRADLAEFGYNDPPPV